MRILLSNDDGIHSPGLRALYRALVEAGHAVDVVAPLTEQSGVGCSVSLHLPLRVRTVREEGFIGTGVAGTPVDCVKLALSELLPRTPDLVVSGINNGGNKGVDVYYSGTVGAATEAALRGLPAAAFSRLRPEMEPPEALARHAVAWMESIEWLRFAGRVLNVNYPRRRVADFKGVRAVRMATSPWGERYERAEEPSGEPSWRIGDLLNRGRSGVDTDSALLDEGWVTVTPLQVDRTDREALILLQERLKR